MSLESAHLAYELSRRQQLVAHLGTWLCYWPGALMLVAVAATAVILAVLTSPWFLLMLLLPPINNNLPRLIAGFVKPLVSGVQRMDVIIEEDRIGFLLGRDRLWLPLDEIVRIERFGDVWAILGSDAGIDIPVSAVDEKYVTHMRARMTCR
jgi:hypothetical protein